MRIGCSSAREWLAAPHRIIFSRPAVQPTIDNNWISDHDRRRVHLQIREAKEPFIHQRLRVQTRGLFFFCHSPHFKGPTAGPTLIMSRRSALVGRRLIA